jgi:methionyl-tRNA synthetase
MPQAYLIVSSDPLIDCFHHFFGPDLNFLLDHGPPFPVLQGAARFVGSDQPLISLFLGECYMTEQPRQILVGVAWPYANGEQHIGHIAGAYLPPDIFSRFQRMCGNNVLMVSGSDTHGTPITVRAEDEGITPREVVDQFHPRFIDSYLGLGLTFDLFTHTDTKNHWDTTHELFLAHYNKGYIYKETQDQLFDAKANRFLPDRYVEGICPQCGSNEARGDQCDTCGATYDAVDLLNPKSKITGSTELEARATEHFFLDLGKLNDPLLDWIKKDKAHWRTHVLNGTRGQLEEHNLRGRPITRDMSWGVTIPLEGYDTKRIYVWYDAVIGYLSASKEWASLTDDSEAWKKWWSNETASEARSYYFIGKDNIPFHTIIWPGMLYSVGGLNLPYDVPANEYMNMKGVKFSKSRGRIIGINDVLERYQADAWRYVLTAMAPETSDVDFTWEDFVDRVNNELLASWGNLVKRVMGFAVKRFDGIVPTPGELTESDQTLLDEIKKGFDSVAVLYDGVKLKSACQEARRLTDLVNNYITREEPFKVIKVDPARAGTIVYNSFQCILWLNTMWSPILPHIAQQVWEQLGFSGPLFGRQYTEMVKDEAGEHLVLRYDHSEAISKWEAVTLPAGQKLGNADGLVVKLDKAVVLEQEITITE